MFAEKNDKQPPILERNIIGKNTSIVGDIISEGDFRIDGKVEGNINAEFVETFENSVIKGNSYRWKSERRYQFRPCSHKKDS